MDYALPLHFYRSFTVLFSNATVVLHTHGSSTIHILEPSEARGPANEARSIRDGSQQLEHMGMTKSRLTQSVVRPVEPVQVADSASNVLSTAIRTTSLDSSALRHNCHAKEGDCRTRYTSGKVFIGYQNRSASIDDVQSILSCPKF